MSYVLDTTTTDTYQYLRCPGSRRVTLQVSNAQILVGFGVADRIGGVGTAEYPPADEPYLPIVGGVSRECDEIRVRSYKAGTPASVKIVAQ